MVAAVSKVARHFQITIPREIRKLCKLREGDLVNFEIRRGEIVISPVCMIKKDQAYFFSRKWQKAIAVSEKEVRQGRHKSYKSARDLERDIEGSPE